MQRDCLTASRRRLLKVDAVAFGLPLNDPVASGLPLNDPVASGLPLNDPVASGLPLNDPVAFGLPLNEKRTVSRPKPGWELRSPCDTDESAADLQLLRARQQTVPFLDPVEASDSNESHRYQAIVCVP